MQHLRGAVAVCETTTQHLHSLVAVCETTMQHLHSVVAVCERIMHHLRSVVAVCERITQHLCNPVAVCETTMQHLRNPVTVCETTMQHLRSPFVMCAPTRVQSFISAGCLVGRMQFAPTRVPGQTSLPPQGPPLPGYNHLAPGTRQTWQASLMPPAKLRRPPQTPSPPPQLLGIVNA